ncbi:MAG: App1 family protein [Micrococcales bacterium]|nr:App1 family protein [Micrococcales bacterium]
MADQLPLLTALIAGHTDRDEEAQVLTLLRAATPDELNALLDGVDMQELFGSVDNRILGPDHRDELIRLLAVDRRAELSTANQADVIHALQQGRTGSGDERAIADMLLAVRGAELTALKNQLNMRADQHDLEGLVYADIDDAAIRDEILTHITAEAPVDRTPREVKVLSDIDDTAFAKLHEERYPKGIVYPGVLAFYQALDQGPADAPRSTGDLTFVTARPGDAFGLIENHSRDALSKAGVANMSLMGGTLTALRSKDAMAGMKFGNMEHYRRLFPEYDLVFIGDSGQGDPIVGEKILGEWPGAVKAVFIHDVVDTPPDRRGEQAAKGLYYVDTYVGAGTTARELGMISDKGLAQIITETRDGFDKVEWESPEQEQAMRAVLERDIAAAGA